MEANDNTGNDVQPKLRRPQVLEARRQLREGVVSLLQKQREPKVDAADALDARIIELAKEAAETAPAEKPSMESLLAEYDPVLVRAALAGVMAQEAGLHGQALERVLTKAMARNRPSQQDLRKAIVDVVRSIVHDLNMASNSDDPQSNHHLSKALIKIAFLCGTLDGVRMICKVCGESIAARDEVSIWLLHTGKCAAIAEGSVVKKGRG